MTTPCPVGGCQSDTPRWALTSSPSFRSTVLRNTQTQSILPPLARLLQQAEGTPYWILLPSWHLNNIYTYKQHQESRSCLVFFLIFLVLSHRTVSASRADNSISLCWNEGDAPETGSVYFGSPGNGTKRLFLISVLKETGRIQYFRTSLSVIRLREWMVHAEVSNTRSILQHYHYSLSGYLLICSFHIISVSVFLVV